MHRIIREGYGDKNKMNHLKACRFARPPSRPVHCSMKSETHLRVWSAAAACRKIAPRSSPPPLEPCSRALSRSAHQSRELLKIERTAAVDVDSSEEFSGGGFGVAPAHDDGERADDFVELHLAATVGVERVEELSQLRSFAITEG